MFMVGVAMAYSCASRQAHGQSYGRMLRHAVVRSIVLVLLGIFLRSDSRPQTNFTFEDVLTQIGLGYTFLFLLWGREHAVSVWRGAGDSGRVLVLVLFLSAAGARFRLRDGRRRRRLAALGRHRGPLGQEHQRRGRFRSVVFEPVPARKPFVYNGGGYLTLSFIPSLATMIFGLLAGELLRSPRTERAEILDARRGRRRRAGQPANCCNRPASARSSNASGRRVGRCSARAGPV